MRGSYTNSMAPLPVTRAMRKLGQDIRDARLRRRITMAVMAERASITRTTLTNTVQQVGQRVPVGHAEIHESRVGRNRKRRFIQAKKAQVQIKSSVIRPGPGDWRFRLQQQY